MLSEENQATGNDLAGRFRCQHCGRDFRFKIKLWMHMEENHGTTVGYRTNSIKNETKQEEYRRYTRFFGKECGICGRSEWVRDTARGRIVCYNCGGVDKEMMFKGGHGSCHCAPRRWDT